MRFHADEPRLTRSPHVGTTDKNSRGLRSLRAVLRSALLAVLHALRIQRPAHDVITHTRQVLYAAAANQHDRVLLQVMTFAADVRDNLVSVHQPHFRYLTQRGVRLLGRRGVHARTYPTLLRAQFQSRALALYARALTRFTNKLIDGRHLVIQNSFQKKRGARVELRAPKSLRLSLAPEAWARDGYGD